MGSSVSQEEGGMVVCLSLEAIDSTTGGRSESPSSSMPWTFSLEKTLDEYSMSQGFIPVVLDFSEASWDYRHKLLGRGL